MRNTILFLSQLIGFFLPWCGRRYLLVRVMGYDIAPTARIGYSYINVETLRMGPNSRIGTFNFVRNLKVLSLGECASIGHLNWITGLNESGRAEHFRDESDRSSELILGEHTAILHRNIIDCMNKITIGAFTTLAGHRSQILTHGINILSSRQTSAPVTIGDYCLVGTKVLILKGAMLPSRSVLGAGSVLEKKYNDEGCLYAGTPARKIKTIPLDAAYFMRTKGYVH